MKWFGGWVCAGCDATQQRISHDNNNDRHAGFEFGVGRKERPQDKYYHVYSTTL